MEFIKDILMYAIIVVIIFLIRLYVIVPAEVIGPSMEPTLNDKEIVVMDQIGPKYYKYKRFDVIVFEYDSPSYLIKRIVGLPGEKIQIKDNTLFVDDEEVEQAFATTGDTKDFSINDLEYTTIPNDMYLVLGDNRENSTDSRTIGLIPKDKITGKIIFRIWPFKQIGMIK